MKRCYDCKKVLWPWQRRGIDWASHWQCHADRVEKFRRFLDSAEQAHSDTLAQFDEEMRKVREFEASL